MITSFNGIYRQMVIVELKYSKTLFFVKAKGNMCIIFTTSRHVQYLNESYG